MLTLTSLVDLVHTSEPTLIPEPINLEYESPILDSHISLMENECESQLFDLNPTLEPYPILEHKLDLIQFCEFVLVPNLSLSSPKQPFHNITFLCWINVLNNLTLR